MLLHIHDRSRQLARSAGAQVDEGLQHGAAENNQGVAGGGEDVDGEHEAAAAATEGRKVWR
ncbi:MAG: hypothetical protein R3D28_11725 [Geminicoccaceae bacterium]